MISFINNSKDTCMRTYVKNFSFILRKKYERNKRRNYRKREKKKN